MTSQGGKHARFAEIAGKTPGTYNGDLIAAGEAVSGRTGLSYQEALYELARAMVGTLDLGPDFAANAAAIAAGATNFSTWNTLPGSLGSGDVIAPVFATAVVNGADLVLTYNEPLDVTSTPTAGDFAVTVATVARSVASVDISGATVVLTLASAVTQGQAVSISYTPGASPIQDIAGNDAAPLFDVAVTNETQAPAGPLSIDPQTFAFGTATRAGQGAYPIVPTAGSIVSVGSLTGANAADFGTPMVSGGQVSIAPASDGSVSQANYSLTLRCYDGAAQTGNFVDVSLTISTFTGRTIAASGDEGTDEIAQIIGLSAVDASGLIVELRPGSYRTSAAQALPFGNPGRIRFTDTLKGLTDILTLRASDAGNKPVIERWLVWNQTGVDGDAGYLLFEDVHFHRGVSEGPPAGSESELVGFRGSFDAVNMTWRRCVFSSNVGRAREYYVRGSQIVALNFNNVNGVLVEDCLFHNLIDCIALLGAHNTVIQRNIARDNYADFLGLNQGCKSVTIRDNEFYSFIGDGRTLHPDWIQGFTANSGAGDVQDIDVFGNVVWFADEGLRMTPVISSSVASQPVTNISFGDTVAGTYTVTTPASYTAFNVNTAGGPITLVLPDADDPNAVRVGVRKSTADANALTVQPAAGESLAGEVDGPTSHDVPHGPEFSFAPSAATWTATRRKHLAVLEFGDTDAGAYTIPAINSRVAYYFDTSGGSITVTLPASSDPDANDIAVQKFSTDPHTVTILPAVGDTLSGEADGAAQHVLAGDFETVTWLPGASTWQAREEWPALQGALLQALAPGNVYFGLRFHGNVIYSNALAGIKTEEDAYGFTAYRNTLVQPWPGDINGDGQANTPADGRASTTGYPAISPKNRPHNAVDSNIHGGLASVDAETDLITLINDFAALDNTLASYTAVFAGQTEAAFNPQTKAEALNALLAKPGSVIDVNNQGALGTTLQNGYYDFVNRQFTDLTAPTIVASRQSPPIDRWLWLEFNKPVKLALTGTVTLFSAADDGVVEVFDLATDFGDAANANGGVPGTICDGGRRIFLRPTANLTAAAGYYIQFGAGVVKTLQGTDFGGIADKTSWAFTAAVPSQNILPWGAQSFAENTVWKTGNLIVTPNPAGDYTIQRVPNPDGTITISLDTSRADYPGGTLPIGNPYTFAFKCKQGTGVAERVLRYRFGLSGSPQFTFNVETGAWTPAAGVELNSSGPDPQGFYRFMVSWTQAASTRWRPENLFGMGVSPDGEDSVIMKEPMLWAGLHSVTGELPYEDPDLP